MLAADTSRSLALSVARKLEHLLRVPHSHVVIAAGTAREERAWALCKSTKEALTPGPLHGSGSWTGSLFRPLEGNWWAHTKSGQPQGRHMSQRREDFIFLWHQGARINFLSTLFQNIKNLNS